MTAPANNEAFRTVLIEGREYAKPWDPSCPACRSPWLVQIDEMLAEGYTFAGIRAVLRGRTPGSPREHHLRDHIDHLAEPHRKLRLELEARAAGDEPASLVDVGAATQAVIARGFQNLAAGKLEVSSKDLLTALRLQAQIERADQAGGMDSTTWQAAFVEFLGLVRQHMPPANWQQFVLAVHSSPTLHTILAQPSELPQGAPNE